MFSQWSMSAQRTCIIWRRAFDATCSVASFAAFTHIQKRNDHTAPRKYEAQPSSQQTSCHQLHQALVTDFLMYKSRKHACVRSDRGTRCTYVSVSVLDAVAPRKIARQRSVTYKTRDIERRVELHLLLQVSARRSAYIASYHRSLCRRCTARLLFGLSDIFSTTNIRFQSYVPMRTE